MAFTHECGIHYASINSAQNHEITKACPLLYRHLLSSHGAPAAQKQPKQYGSRSWPNLASKSPPMSLRCWLSHAHCVLWQAVSFNEFSRSRACKRSAKALPGACTRGARRLHALSLCKLDVLRQAPAQAASATKQAAQLF